MNVKLMLPLIAALALTPLLVSRHGVGFHPVVGSGYTSDWQMDAQAVVTEQAGRFECAGADLLRRAAPPVIGRTAKAPWLQSAMGLAPRNPVLCINS
jgi:hypothetical protein